MTEFSGHSWWMLAGNQQLEPIDGNQFEISSNDIHECHIQCDDHPWSAQQWQSTIDNPNTRLFGIFVEPLSPRLIALACYQVLSVEVELFHVFLLSEFRGQGFGSHLLRKSMTSLQSEGVESVFLEVANDNVQAIKIYHTLGFKEYGRRKGYYTRNSNSKIDALLMRFDFLNLNQ